MCVCSHGSKHSLHFLQNECTVWASFRSVSDTCIAHTSTSYVLLVTEPIRLEANVHPFTGHIESVQAGQLAVTSASPLRPYVAVLQNITAQRRRTPNLVSGVAAARFPVLESSLLHSFRFMGLF